MGLTGPRHGAVPASARAGRVTGGPQRLIIAVTAVLIAFLIAAGAAPIAIGIAGCYGLTAAVAYLSSHSGLMSFLYSAANALPAATSHSDRPVASR